MKSRRLYPLSSPSMPIFVKLAVYPVIPSNTQRTISTHAVRSRRAYHSQVPDRVSVSIGLAFAVRPRHNRDEVKVGLLIRHQEAFCVITNTSHLFEVAYSSLKTATQNHSHQHLLYLLLHHYNCDQHRAQSPSGSELQRQVERIRSTLVTVYKTDSLVHSHRAHLRLRYTVLRPCIGQVDLRWPIV